MMLFHKAWLESRTRFLLGATAMTGLIALFVFLNQDARGELADRSATYSQYLWSAIYKGYLRNIFVVLVLLLGMGGLERERGYGTAGFTLALPVSRWRLVATRAAVGIAESTFVAFLPAALLPLLSPLVNETYSWPQALHFGILWAVGGAIWFAMGFLASTLFSGEYSAPMAAMAFLFGYSIAADLPGVERYVIDVHDLMNGTQAYGPATLALVPVAAIALIALAGVLTKRRDF
jgi:ABC-type transport system involved in multi-copper enzyme maturation permease subunit